MKVILRLAAREDILRQYRYYLIEQEAETAAERFLRAVQAAIEHVSRRPGIGTPKALKDTALAGLRSWPVKGFSAIRIYYIKSENVFRVVRVLHGKRDLDPILEDQPVDSEQ